MKLNKLTFEWLIYHAKHSERAGHTELQIMEEIETALKAGTLEIEGYVRADHFADDSKKVSWTKFDPDDEATYPPETAEYLVALDGWAFARAVAFYESDNAFDTDEDVTHWRPLPKPPVESEVGK